MTEALPKRRVNRAEQVSEVRTRLNQIRVGRLVFDSLLEWYGIPGIGKTTLGEMIADLCHEMSVPFSRLDLDPQENRRAARYAEQPDLLLEDLFLGLGVEEPVALRDALAGLRQTEGEAVRVEAQAEVTREFLAYLNRLFARGPVVLLFDSTDAASPALADWLEEHVLSPLALSGHCVLIWTGRYPQRWKRFEVRRRVVSHKLAPLPLEATVEHVGAQGDRVYRLTRGHPKSNEEIAGVIRDFQARGQEAPDHMLISVLVDKVLDNYVMQGMDEELKDAMRILAVVRQFDVAFLHRLLTKYVPYYAQQQAFLSEQTRLAATFLVEWDRSRKGYAMDSTVRRILALHLRYTDRARYLEANRDAAALYAEWIERMRENPSTYIVEHIYHEAAIAIAEGRPPAAWVPELESELQGYLERYYRDPDLAWAQKKTEQLRQEIQADSELQEMLGEDFRALTDVVQAHLQQQ